MTNIATDQTTPQKMLSLRLKGYTLQEIADHFQVTKGWVGKTIDSVKGDIDPEEINHAVNLRKILPKAERSTSYRELIRLAAQVRTHPGELFVDNDLDLDHLRALRHEYLEGLLIPKVGRRQTYSNKAMIEAVKRTASKVSDGHLSAKAYAKLSDEGYPSDGAIIRRFGTWNKVLAEAGLNSVNDVRDEPYTRWDQGEMLGTVKRFFREKGLEQSSYAYTKWANAQRSDLPGVPVMLSRLGGWTVIRARILDNSLKSDGEVLIAGEHWTIDDIPLDVLESTLS